DRIAVAARIGQDSPKLRVLSGNQVGVALVHYVLTRRQERGTLSPEHVVFETYVTTSLIAEIGRRFGRRVVDDLVVGYKFIAERIGKLPDPGLFVFAAEESLGYLAGDFVRDKDGAIASLLVAELASWLKERGKTLVQYLDDVYREYGYYKNAQ